MNILPFVLAAMNAIAPNRDHTALGAAIAREVSEQAPLFADDGARERTAAFVIAVAFRESSLRNDAIGDKGQSHCAFQIHLPGASRTKEGWSGADLRDDVDRCVSVAFRMLRQSIRIDREHPLAFYARGPRWKTEEARRLSRDRVALARRLHAIALAALAAESST